MGILRWTCLITLDGVHQAPGGPDEDPSDAFEYAAGKHPTSATSRAT